MKALQFTLIFLSLIAIVSCRTPDKSPINIPVEPVVPISKLELVRDINDKVSGTHFLERKINGLCWVRCENCSDREACIEACEAGEENPNEACLNDIGYLPVDYATLADSVHDSGSDEPIDPPEAAMIILDGDGIITSMTMTADKTLVEEDEKKPNRKDRSGATGLYVKNSKDASFGRDTVCDCPGTCEKPCPPPFMVATGDGVVSAMSYKASKNSEEVYLKIVPYDEETDAFYTKNCGDDKFATFKNRTSGAYQTLYYVSQGKYLSVGYQQISDLKGLKVITVPLRGK